MCLFPLSHSETSLRGQQSEMLWLHKMNRLVGVVAALPLDTWAYWTKWLQGPTSSSLILFVAVHHIKKRRTVDTTKTWERSGATTVSVCLAPSCLTRPKIIFSFRQLLFHTMQIEKIPLEYLVLFDSWLCLPSINHFVNPFLSLLHFKFYDNPPWILKPSRKPILNTSILNYEVRCEDRNHAECALSFHDAMLTSISTTPTTNVEMSSISVKTLYIMLS